MLLLPEVADDGYALFGLYELGEGCPGVGSVSLTELQEISASLPAGLERDGSFWPAYPLLACARTANRGSDYREAQRTERGRTRLTRSYEKGPAMPGLLLLLHFRLTEIVASPSQHGHKIMLQQRLPMVQVEEVASPEEVMDCACTFLDVPRH